MNAIIVLPSQAYAACGRCGVVWNVTQDAPKVRCPKCGKTRSWNRALEVGRRIAETHDIQDAYDVL